MASTWECGCRSRSRSSCPNHDRTIIHMEWYARTAEARRSVHASCYNAIPTAQWQFWPELTLYQYQTCPFAARWRAFLTITDFATHVVEVNPVLRKEIKWSSYRKVPILVCESNGIRNSISETLPLIISIMKTFLAVSGRELSFDEMLGYYPTATQLNRYAVMYGESHRHKDTRQEEKKWREWADNTLVHYLSPNVYRTSGEALQAFRYFSDVGEWERLFPAWERYLVIYVGAAAMFLVGKRLKKKYNMKEDVRETLYDACRHWTKHVGKQRTFMGGDKPNLADLAVYGILNSIEGCEAFQDVLTNTKIGDWYYNTQQAVKLHVGSELLAEHCYDRYFKRKAN
ncbi:PREDICTED: LOW QUALITY PROTEIN: prostaglandin E synthase 2-like [Priapulus caudatus]|uniref:LOW QUALITY PROTEIN: prostaglandin E synthase 2-like n=1 Tax=Priapulus caudatus TaxID=37621 RepID=A0ABM1E6B9_PRICU|nr:PREDICTED: LOW QUALITY PROTEIN: prostaglandin E synthase 2-like [Priapulus caudatus]